MWLRFLIARLSSDLRRVLTFAFANVFFYLMRSALSDSIILFQTAGSDWIDRQIRNTFSYYAFAHQGSEVLSGPIIPEQFCHSKSYRSRARCCRSGTCLRAQTHHPASTIAGIHPRRQGSLLSTSKRRVLLIMIGNLTNWLQRAYSERLG